jgi:hypothetical protein
LKRGFNQGGLGYWRRFWPEEEDADVPDEWGLHGSEGEGEIGYRFGKGFLGRGLDLELGQIVSPGPFSIFIFFSPFLFLFSGFPISFITFAYINQTRSNQFLNFA